MRKVFALVIGLLMLGGMMGMVSAAFSGNVLHFGTSELTSSGYMYHNVNTAGLLTIQQYYVLWYEAVVQNFDSPGGKCLGVMQVDIKDTGNNIYTYGFYYCGQAGEIEIQSNDTNFVPKTVQYDITKPNAPLNLTINVTSQGIKFYINPQINSQPVYSYTKSFVQVQKVKAGNTTGDITFDLYIDNINEFGVSQYGPTQGLGTPEDFEDGKDDFFGGTTQNYENGGVVFNGNYVKEIVPADQVPFFSNAGIAAVTLLLVLGAVWFFRRQ